MDLPLTDHEPPGQYVRAAWSRLLDSVYRGPVKTTLHRLGADRVLRQLHERVLDATVPPEVVLVHDETRLRFPVGNRFEYTVLMRYDAAPDRPVLADFVERLAPGDVVWDVGANVGIFSSFAAAALDSGTVVALEPHPKNVERIRENLARNGLEARICQLALADEVGTGTFSVSSPDVTGAFGFLTDGTDEVSIDVELAAGDGLVAEGTPAPTVLKVDVQGGELSVLEGLTATLDQHCRLVYCNVYEKHFETGDEGDRIRALLTDAGFEVTRLGDWSGGYFIRAERTVGPEREGAIEDAERGVPSEDERVQ